MKTRSKVLPIRLSNNQVIFATVDILGGEEDVASSKLSFDGALSAIEEVGSQIISVFDTIKPQKARVEFGIRFSADAGKLTTFLVDAKGDATLKIALEWEGDRQSG